MGETSLDTQREIESLRDDLSATVGELERRARRLVDLRAQAREHPEFVGVIGLGLLAGAAALGYNAVSGYRESQKPVNRLKRRAGALSEDIREGLGRTREAMPVRVSRQKREDESVDTTQQEPGMIKKLLWMGLAAATVAATGLLARRLSSAIWEAVMREPPPTSKV